MLREYGKSYESIWVKLSRPLIIILALILVILVLYMVSVFWNMLSVEQENLLDGLQAQKNELLDKIGVLITEAGYVEEGESSNPIYVPTIRGFVTNSTENELDTLMLRAVIRSGDKIVCQTQIPIMQLQKKETRNISLRCIEMIGFGTIMKGMNLFQTTYENTYSIQMTYNDITVEVFADKLKYKILN